MKFYMKLIVFLIVIELVYCLSFCEDWIPFKDNKCFKIIEKSGTEEEALKNCTKVDSNSTLITIESKEEEDFIIESLKKYNNIADKVWLGIKWNNNSFEWIDGKPLTYSNWGKDAIKDGSLPCAQLSFGTLSLGKWTDESCKKTALIVCQRKPLDDSSEVQLKKMVESLIKMIEKQQKQINSIKNDLIPIGFLYTQLPYEQEPNHLWPGMTWIEVTQNYSGMFFRAEGGDSLEFGSIQKANSSIISNIVARSSVYNNWKDDQLNGPVNIPLKQTNWTVVRPAGLLYWLEFYMTSGENRPYNTAVKIWKRTG